MPLFKLAISFKEKHTLPAEFSNAITAQANVPLAQVVGGYLWRWFLSADDIPLALNGLVAACRCDAKLDLAYLAAEAASLGELTSHPQARDLNEKAAVVHAGFRTQSMRDLAIPVAHWRLAISALQQFTSRTQDVADGAEVFGDERMIWELQYGVKFSSLSVRPITQKRSGGGWSKGRPILLGSSRILVASVQNGGFFEASAPASNDLAADVETWYSRQCREKPTQALRGRNSGRDIPVDSAPIARQWCGQSRRTLLRRDCFLDSH